MIESGVLHIIIPTLVVVCALLVAIFKDLIAAVISLAAMSLLLALEFYFLQAPDVAIAEAGVGAAITVAIYILAIRATRQHIGVGLNRLKRWWMTWRKKTMIESGVLHIIIPTLVVVCALLVAIFKDLIAAVISLAAMSLLLALEFYFLQAPDVAIAEAGVGAAITVAIYILAIRATKRE